MNGICNSECFTAECGYDKTDCGCAPGCLKIPGDTRFDYCSTECMDLGCDYNSVVDEYEKKCNDSFTQYANFYMQMQLGSFQARFIKFDCFKSDRACSQNILKTAYTSKTCTAGVCMTQECLYQMFACKSGTSPAFCDKWDHLGNCLMCKNDGIHVQFFGSCLETCPLGYSVVAQHLVPQRLCGSQDTTYERSAAYIYVTNSEGTNKGTGTLNDPYRSLSYALSRVWNQYTFVLLSQGVHNLFPDIYDNIAANEPNSPLYRMHGYYSDITITTAYCSEYPEFSECATERATILVQHIISILANALKFTLEDLNFDGGDLVCSLASCNNCSIDTCKYCPYITILQSDSNQFILNDKLENISQETYASYGKNCENIFKDFILIQGIPKSEIFINNVTFKNFQMRSNPLIDVKDSSLYLTSVDFERISPGYTSTDAVIRIVCKDSVDSYYKFQYTGGNVKYLNDGYELNAFITQGGFLYTSKVDYIDILNVDFSFNIVQKSEEDQSTEGGLIYIVSCKYLIKLSNCKFFNNYVHHGVLYINNDQLNINDYDLKSRISKITHFQISSISVYNNTGNYGLITITNNFFLQNFKFSSVSFYKCISLKGDMIAILNKKSLNDIEKQTGFIQSSTVNNENKFISKRYFTMESFSISECYSVKNIIHLLNLTNVKLMKFDIISSCNQSRSNTVVNLYTMNDFKTEGLSNTNGYCSDINIVCDAVIWLETLYNINWMQGTFSSITSLNESEVNFFIKMTGSIGYIDIDSVTFENLNSSDVQGGPINLSYVTNNNVYIRNCVFKDITNKIGAAGIYILDSKNVQILNSSFINTQSRYDGAIKLRNAGQVTIDSCIFSENRNIEKDGVIYVELTDYEDFQEVVNIHRTTFYKCEVKQGLGCIYITETEKLPWISINFSSLRFTECQAEAGSAMGFPKTVYLRNCLIDDITVDKNINTLNAGPVDVQHSGGIFRISNSIFTNNSGETCAISVFLGISEEVINLTNITITHNTCRISTLLFLGFNSSSVVKTSLLNISNNECCGVTLSNIIMEDSDSTYDGNYPAIYIYNYGTARLTNAIIKNNKNKEKGAGVYLLSSSKFLCLNCIFTNNESDFGAAILAEHDCFISLITCTFEKNYARMGGSAIGILGTYLLTSLMDDCIFRDNLVYDSGTIALNTSRLKITNSVIQNNISTISSPGISMLISILILENTRMSGHTALEGAYLSATTKSEVTIENCIIEDGVSTTNAGAIVLNSSKAIIKNSIFRNLFSRIQGGAIMAMSRSTVKIENCKFFNITSEYLGAILYAAESTAEIIDTECDTFRTTGIYGSFLESLHIDNTTFINGFGYNGAGFMCLQCKEVSVKNSIFDSNSARFLGGAINLISSTSDSEIFPYVFINNIFINNTAGTGGALNINGNDLTFINNQFKYNKATRQGGALMVQCTEFPYCNLTIHNSEFMHNIAELIGGAIYWLDSKPLINDDTVFENNTANYGNDIASFPIRMQVTENNQIIPYLNDKSDENYPLAIQLSRIAPGQKLEYILKIALIDHYDQIVSSNTLYDAKISEVNSEDHILTGTNEVIADAGVFKFDNIYMNAKPGSQLYFTVKSPAIDKDKKEKAGDDIEHISLIYLEVNLRNCLIGEFDLGDGCQLCDQRTYSLDPEEPCQDCPSDAYCLGNFTMYPMKHYWRANKYSDIFLECPNSDACLGSEDFSSYTGECEKGYKGNMCQPCDNDYSRTNDNVCQKCPEDMVNVLRLIGIGMGIMVYCIIMVRVTFTSVYVPQSLQSIYIKIFLNYLQLAGITIGFNIPWPEPVLEFASFHKSSGQAVTQIFSMDCFMMTNSDDAYITVYYEKLSIISCIPLMLFLVCISVWSLIAIFKRKKSVQSYLKIEMVATLIILFFFFHPIITRVYLSIFSCREIEGEGYYLMDNLDIECWVGDHLRYALSIALPSVIIWVIGVPCYVLIYLIKNRKNVREIDIKLKLGFLYNGYRLKTYYWEFVIIYRKVLIIMITVFLSSFSVDVQVLAGLFVLIGSYILQIYIDPYQSYTLNYIDRRGILVSAVTLYCGLYYLTGNLDTAIELVFFGVMVMINAYYLIYWLYYFLESWWGLAIYNLGFLRRKFDKLDGYEQDILEYSRLYENVYIQDNEKRFTLITTTKQQINIYDTELPNSMLELYKEIALKEGEYNCEGLKPLQIQQLATDWRYSTPLSCSDSFYELDYIQNSADRFDLTIDR